jgi:hypothetical protein
VQLQDYINDVQELVHDTSQSIWPVARLIWRINQARLYTSLDMKCVRQLVTNVQLMTGVETYDIGIQNTNPGTPGTLPFNSTLQYSGTVSGCTVTAAGSNYGLGTTVPITFSAPPSGGIQAQGYGNLDGGSLGNNGSLVSVTMTTWGQGYQYPATATVGGSGSGATVQPVTMIGVLYPISITYLFNEIRTTLRYIPFGLFQAYARILGVQFLSTPGVWTYVPEINLIYIQPQPNQNYISEWDCVFAAQPLVNTTDFDSQIVEPWQRAPQYMAAAQLLLKTRSYGEAGIMWDMYERTIPKIVTAMGDVRIPNVYNRNFQRLVAR